MPRVVAACGAKLRFARGGSRFCRLGYFGSAIGEGVQDMRRSALISIIGGVALAIASTANGQTVPGGPPPGTGNNTGGPRVQDIAASNRQQDTDYNTLAGRGVKVTNEDRANLPRPGGKDGSVGPATAADIKPGAPVRDVKGVPVGTIAVLAPNEVVADSNQAVIDTGQTKIGVPLIAFGKDDKGLLLSITAEKFNQLVAQAHAGSQAQSTKSN
jgi:hypothetical protein